MFYKPRTGPAQIEHDSGDEARIPWISIPPEHKLCATENSSCKYTLLLLRLVPVMDNLPVFPSFDYDSDKANAGPRWKRWVQRLENLFVGLKLEDGKQKKALLLHYGGERVYDIYDAEKGSEEPDYEATKKILTTYFEPKINVIMEVYSFRNCRQSDDQSLEEYVTELRQLAKTCQFADSDSEILAQLIQGCKSGKLRRRALRDSKINLVDLLDYGRTLELSNTQAIAMEDEKVNAVGWRKSRNSKQKKGKGEYSPHTVFTRVQVDVVYKSTPDLGSSKQGTNFYLTFGNHDTQLVPVDRFPDVIRQ